MMKTRLYIFVFVAAMGLSAGIAGAQEPLDGVADGPRVMTLRDCMEYAISNSTKMRIQQAAVSDARLERRDAALALFTPKISAQTYAYYNFGRSIDPQTNTYFNTTSFHNNYGVSAGYELFDGFSAVNNYKISKTGMLIASSQQKQVEADICLAVMEAYYNVVYYKRLADIYEEQAEAAKAALHKAKRQEELGQKGHADVVQMEADLAERSYELTNTFNMYENQKMILADLMFWPLEEELQIETSIPVWEVEPISANAVVDYALEHNPTVQIASAQQLNAKRELNTAKWQLLPSVGIYAGWSTSYYNYRGANTAPFSEQFKNNGGEYVQLSISIPIFNRLAGYSKISRKRNALKRASAELESKRREVESEVRRAIHDRDGSAAAYRQAEHKVRVQEEAYNLNRKKLEQGLISPLEFQTANNNYLKAQADKMNSLFTYLIKQAVVRYYNGVEYVNQ
ncbi:MAG: TolC family protein [Bacteroidales bacterium]|nr:TolC family protein [Bacteroidales bacterium]